MTDHEHEGMKFCSGCETWKPATAEYFHRDKTMTCGLYSQCKVCKSGRGREYRQKNNDRICEYNREYRQKNKEKVAEIGRRYREENKEKVAERKRRYREENKEKIAERRCRYYEKNKDKISEYNASNVGRLRGAVGRIRRKTGATIYVRDMTDEEKETLANQYVAIRTLEKTEKELLSASGKKRCTKCDRVLDYDCFNKNPTKTDGVDCWCGECRAERQREYYEKNKDKMKEYWRERYQKNKDKASEYYEKNKDKIRERYQKTKKST